MPKREVDKRKTARALRKLRHVATRATGEGGPGLTNWEKDFVEGVSGRLETYGSAFRDPGKGRLEEALSQRQAHVVSAIDKKTRKPKTAKTGAAKEEPRREGLRRSSFKRKTPIGGAWAPRVRDINEDSAPPPPAPDLTPERKRAALRLVPGGKPAGKKP